MTPKVHSYGEIVHNLHHNKPFIILEFVIMTRFGQNLETFFNLVPNTNAESVLSLGT